MRDGFIFYRSFHDAASSLPDDIRLKVYDMIIEYALTGVEPECSGIEKTIFILVKPQLDANTRRYENGKKGAEHGAKGGRPKTPKEPQENPTETPKEKEKEKEKEKVKEKNLDVSFYDISKFLTKQSMEVARQNANGKCIDYLIGVFNEGVNSGKMAAPDRPNSAFPAWVLGMK